MQPAGVQSTWNQGRWPRLAPVLRLPSQYSTVVFYCLLTATHFAYPERMTAWVKLARPGNRTQALSMRGVTYSIQPHRRTTCVLVSAITRSGMQSTCWLCTWTPPRSSLPAMPSTSSISKQCLRPSTAPLDWRDPEIFTRDFFKGCQ